MTANAIAPIEDQKKILECLKMLEWPPDMKGESVREQDLILSGCFFHVENPEECIQELLGAGIVYRKNGDILLTEKDYKEDA